MKFTCAHCGNDYELDLAPAYTFTLPVEVRKFAADLSLTEVLPLTRKGEHWLYEPRTGLLTIVPKLEEEGTP